MLEASDKGDYMTKETLRIARAKLLCHTDIHLPFDDYTIVGRSALLDCRLMLDYVPRHEHTFEREVELVASHMRIAYSVPKSREVLRSGYSSEPLLAEAAAQFAHFRKPAGGGVEDPELYILKRNLKDKLVDLGQRVELIARHLLTLVIGARFNLTALFL